MAVNHWSNRDEYESSDARLVGYSYLAFAMQFKRNDMVDVVHVFGQRKTKMDMAMHQNFIPTSLSNVVHIEINHVVFCHTASENEIQAKK